MQGIQAFVARRLNTILLLLLAGGFAILIAELLLTGHVEGIQLVAPISSALGLAAVVLGLFARGGLRMAVVIVLLLVSLGGVVGTLRHWVEAGEPAGQPGDEAEPPPLAPLSIAGLGLMSLVVLVGRGHEPELPQSARLGASA